MWTSHTYPYIIIHLSDVVRVLKMGLPPNGMCCSKAVRITQIYLASWQPYGPSRSFACSHELQGGEHKADPGRPCKQHELPHQLYHCPLPNQPVIPKRLVCNTTPTKSKPLGPSDRSTIPYDPKVHCTSILFIAPFWLQDWGD